MSLHLRIFVATNVVCLANVAAFANQVDWITTRLFMTSKKQPVYAAAFVFATLCFFPEADTRLIKLSVVPATVNPAAKASHLAWLSNHSSILNECARLSKIP